MQFLTAARLLDELVIAGLDLGVGRRVRLHEGLRSSRAAPRSAARRRVAPSRPDASRCRGARLPCIRISRLMSSSRTAACNCGRVLPALLDELVHERIGARSGRRTVHDGDILREGGRRRETQPATPRHGFFSKSSDVQLAAEALRGEFKGKWEGKSLSETADRIPRGRSFGYVLRILRACRP